MIVEQFPVGMRVLAVDDDPICLKLLETLLHKCRYHVTTTSQAIKALKLLRENKNKFDLVISDVHMPDMDGFKLLELVGLEMDLPVIMLSANGDTKLVMKGITHGACDYLLKPVRIEELKNIWQHVVRRRKVDPKDQNNSDKFYTENEGEQTLAVTGESDENCKLIRKRKDQNEDDNEDRESGPNNKDLSTQKKPRVVWTGDLHRKFVAAVRELGVDEAVPKKILDLMNVEKLTRENVASHLQKYRSYLKRLASQEAHVVAALGGPDSAYLRLTSPNGFGDLQNLIGSPQFQSAAIRPFSSGGMLGRLSAPAGLTMHTHSSSGTIQLCRAGNLNNPIKHPCKFQPVIIPGNQNGNVLQGMPTSFEVDQPELNKGVNCSQHLSIANNNSSVFCISGNFPDGNINQSCGTMTSSNMEFTSHLPDFARCTDSWSAVQPNSLSSWDFKKMAIPGDCGNSMSSISSNSCNISSVNTISAGISDLRADFSQNLGFEENNLTAYQNPNLVCNSMISSHGVLGPMTPYNNSLDHKNTGFSKYNDINVGERECLVDPLIMKHNEVEQSALQTTVFLKRGYLVDQTNSLDGYSYNNVGSLEDLVHAMMKQD